VQKTIFIVDDSPSNLATAAEVLESQYIVITMSSSARMFAMLEKVNPDLILLDIEMPETDGFTAIRQLKAIAPYAEIPVIFVTGLTSTENEALGIELGAVDFIGKPFSPPVLLNRIKHHLQIDEIVHERTEQLKKRTEQLLERTDQLEKLQNSIVFTLADVVENRDANTGGHIERITKIMKLLLEAMIKNKLYVDEIRSWDLISVISSSRLHDLGKITISDTILNKPGKLTDEEYTLMKMHCAAGERIIEQMTERTGNAEFLHHAKLFAAYHQEKWNGEGYPHGLKGKDIPLQGRIMAIVDVYDALTTVRPYKIAFSHEDAIDVIKKGAGTHFDPDIANLFCEIENKIELSRIKY